MKYLANETYLFTGRRAACLRPQKPTQLRRRELERSSEALLVRKRHVQECRIEAERAEIMIPRSQSVDLRVELGTGYILMVLGTHDGYEN